MSEAKASVRGGRGVELRQRQPRALIFIVTTRVLNPQGMECCRERMGSIRPCLAHTWVNRPQSLEGHASGSRSRVANECACEDISLEANARLWKPMLQFFARRNELYSARVYPSCFVRRSPQSFAAFWLGHRLICDDMRRQRGPGRPSPFASSTLLLCRPRNQNLKRA